MAKPQVRQLSLSVMWHTICKIKPDTNVHMVMLQFVECCMTATSSGTRYAEQALLTREVSCLYFLVEVAFKVNSTSAQQL